jgi:hypothetical protein
MEDATMLPLIRSKKTHSVLQNLFFEADSNHARTPTIKPCHVIGLRQDQCTATLDIILLRRRPLLIRSLRSLNTRYSSRTINRSDNQCRIFLYSVFRIYFDSHVSFAEFYCGGSTLSDTFTELHIGISCKSLHSSSATSVHNES